MSERRWQELSPAQADGLACVVCGADYLTVRAAHRPVGHSQSGSQVFACRGRCAEQAAQDEDLARGATEVSLLAEGHLLLGGRPGQGKNSALQALLWQATLAEHGTPLVFRDEAPGVFGSGGVMGEPDGVDLDDTTGCLRAGSCEGCQATAGLAVCTATAIGGVLCLTLCPSCDPPRLPGPEVARRTLSHCQHLGIDIDEMAAALARERGAER